MGGFLSGFGIFFVCFFGGAGGKFELKMIEVLVISGGVYSPQKVSMTIEKEPLEDGSPVSYSKMGDFPLSC